MDIGQIIERDIGAEGLKHNPLRLKGQHNPAGTNGLREKDGKGANISAGVNHDIVGPEDLAIQFYFRFIVLAVQVVRSADVHVVDVVQHGAIAALLETIERNKCHVDLPRSVQKPANAIRRPEPDISGPLSRY